MTIPVPSPLPSPVPFGGRDLRYTHPEDTGPDVTTLQFLIKTVDPTYTGPVDGTFGPDTDTGVRRLQARYGLAVDGVVGPVTYWTLGTATGPFAGGAPPFGSRRLAVGDHGGDVEVLQNRLAVAGYPNFGPASGRFDADTAAAVSAFQSAVGLAATGDLDLPTATELTRRTWMGGRHLSRHTQGADVRTLQAALNGILGDRLPTYLAVDGRFGDSTAAAVMAFQRLSGLAQDGVVGPQTFFALGRHAGRLGLEPTAGRVAFARQDRDGWAVVTSRPDGSDLHSVVAGLAEAPQRILWSPDLRWIAYAAGPLLSVVASDGGEPRTLGVVASVDYAWAPDSESLAVTFEGPQVFVADRRTGATRFLVEGARPVWFPDGEGLAFVAPDGLSVHTVDPAGGPTESLVTADAPVGEVAISPDGTRLAFTLPGAASCRLAIADLEAGTVRTVPEGPAVRDTAPAWSPTGQLLAYWSVAPGARHALVANLRLADAHGNPLWTVGTSSCVEPGPIAFSPSGLRLIHGSGCAPRGGANPTLHAAALFAVAGGAGAITAGSLAHWGLPPGGGRSPDGAP